MATEAEKARHLDELEKELGKAEIELVNQWRIWQFAVECRLTSYQRVAIDAKQKADKWEKKADELRGRIVALKYPHS